MFLLTLLYEVMFDVATLGFIAIALLCAMCVWKNVRMRRSNHSIAEVTDSLEAVTYTVSKSPIRRAREGEKITFATPEASRS